MSGEAVDEKSNAKIVVLILHDSHSSAVQAVPVRSNGGVQHMVRESARFIEHLGHGHGDIGLSLRCDQEPAMLDLQSVLQRTLRRLGRRVVCENSKILDHASNSWVEKSIDRVRNRSFYINSGRCLKLRIPLAIHWWLGHSYTPHGP